MTKKSGKQTRSPGRPRREDLATIENHLIEVARDLFFEYGYGHTTMSAVAERARVSKTTLYSRFPAKADLFKAMATKTLESWAIGQNRVEIDERATISELLNAYGDLVMRAGMSKDFMQINRLVFSESERFPELAEVAAGNFELGVSYLGQQIALRAEREGVVCKDTDGVARNFLFLLEGWLRNAALTKDIPNMTERLAWLSRAVRLIFQGSKAW